MGGKRVISLIAFRTRVSLIMLFSLSQSRCLVAALGSSSSYCSSYPCLLRHFPKITFGATTKPPPPLNPLPLEIVLTEGAEQGSRRRLYLESKAPVFLCGYTALSLEQVSAESGLQFPLSPLEGAIYTALNMRGVTNGKRATHRLA